MQVQTASNALPPARPQPADNAGSGDAFAQLLARQPEVEPEAEAPTTPSGARPDEARAAKARQGAARTPAPKTSPAETAPRGAREVGEARDGGSEPGEAANTEAPTPALDPALSQWLAQLHRPQAEAEAAAPTTLLPGHAPATGAAPGRDTAIDAATDDAAGHALQATEGRGASAGRLSAQRHGEAAERATLSRAEDTTPRTAEDSANPAAAAARASSEPAFVLPASPEPGAAAAAAGAATPSTTTAAAAADAPLAASVPVPMESPDFAEAFGVQVSLLARDGVQEAELHLNPAEMGPVSVQIVLDGERARIDFGAQAAATRAAIEASLPELAAALRDAGLTLAGGGVSQHGAGRGDDTRQGEPGAHGDARERAGAADATAPRPTWRGRVSAGGVDLYA